MKVLATFPGRNGDLLWALPVIRAISAHYGVPVDLQISAEFTGIVPLLEQQPYLGAVWADPRWAMTPPEEWRAPTPSSGEAEPYQHLFHCGYRGWPEKPLPFWTELGVKMAYRDLADLRVDYDTPWVTVSASEEPHYAYPLVCGWSDEWFELKYGVTHLLRPRSLCVICPVGSRWRLEGAHLPIFARDWTSAARWIAQGKVFLGCCSALHVLACAMGKPVVVMEPSQARHNPIFYPFGMEGRITVVKGLDGLPTVDARHCAETIERVRHAQ